MDSSLNPFAPPPSTNSGGFDLNHTLDLIRNQESKGNPFAANPSGAMGPYQIMPQNYQKAKIDPTNETVARKWAGDEITRLHKKYGGDMQKVLAAYNWGEGNVDKYGLQKAPAETRQYIQKILGTKMQTQAGNPFAPPAASAQNQPPRTQAAQQSPMSAEEEDFGFHPVQALSNLFQVSKEHPLQVIPGAMEALAGGTIGMVKQLAAMGVGAAKDIVELVKGQPDLHKGLETYQQTAEKLDKALPFNMETEVGQKFMDLLGQVPGASSKLGHIVADKTGSPIAGALTEATINGLMIEQGFKSAGAKAAEKMKAVESGPVEAAAAQTKPIVRMVGQTAEGKPILKQVGQSDIPLSQKPTSPSNILVGKPKPPHAAADPRSLSNALYQLGQMDKAKRIEVLQNIDKIVPKGYTEEVARRRYIAREEEGLPQNQRSVTLSPEEKAFDKDIQPIRDRNAYLYGELKKMNAEVDDEGYIHRLAVGKTGLLEDLKGQIPQSKNLGGEASAFKGRKYFAVEDMGGGRHIAAYDGHKLSIYQGGKVIDEINSGQVKVGEIFKDDLNRSWVMKQARTKEIEDATPTRYHKNELASEIDANLGLEKMYRETKFLEDFKSQPDFKKIGLKISEAHHFPPEGWKVTKVPQFRGYYMEPRIAEALDDWASRPGMSGLEKAAGINRIIIGSMFYDPLPHIWNVADHWAVNRGLTDWINPVAYPRLARTFVRAAKSVFTQDQLYRNMLNKGGALMESNVLLENFQGKLLSKLGADPKLTPVAKAFGYANPAAWVKGIYKASRHGMWGANDILMMQAYLERMEKTGESARTAIQQTEKHIPNYRIPERVLGNRILSQALNNPNVVAFGRYDYGRLRAFGEMTKSLMAGKTLAERAHAMDQLAMVAFMGLVVYPYILDELAKGLTGNPNATANRSGTQTLPALLFDLLSGDKAAKDTMSTMLPFSPLMKGAAELMTNTNFFTGEPLANWDAGAASAARDYTEYLATTSAPIADAIRMWSGKQSMDQFIAKDLGMKSPTDQQLAAKEYFKQKRMKDAQRLEKKRRWTSEDSGN